MTFNEFASVMSEVSFKDWDFRIGILGEGYFLQATFKDIDHDTNELSLIKGRKWYISSFAIEDEIVKTAWVAVKMAMEHEMMEQFQYKGKAPFHPHHEVNGLLDRPMCHRTEILPEVIK